MTNPSRADQQHRFWFFLLKDIFEISRERREREESDTEASRHEISSITHIYIHHETYTQVYKRKKEEKRLSIGEENGSDRYDVGERRRQE